MSQPDTVTLVDYSSSNVDYTRHEENVNRTTYISEIEHTPDRRNQFQLYRTYAKRNGNSRGHCKSAVKITIDMSVPNAPGDGNIILPAIAEATFSIPLGLDDTNRQDVIARLASTFSSGTLIEKLTKQLTI